MTNTMKQYAITMKVKGHFCSNFKVNTKKEAEQYALEAFYNADFKELERIDMTSCKIEKSVCSNDTYDMTAIVTGIYTGVIEANSEEQAIKEADNLFFEADFGELDDSDIEDIIEIEIMR